MIKAKIIDNKLVISEKEQAKRKRNLIKQEKQKQKEIKENEAKKAEYKKLFYKNGNWSIMKVKKHFGNYTQAYIAFVTTYKGDHLLQVGSLLIPKTNKSKQLYAFIEKLQKKAFGKNIGLTYPSNSRIQLLEMTPDKKKEMLRELIDFKLKYTTASNADFLQAITTIMDIGLNSSTIRQYLKDNDDDSF